MPPESMEDACNSILSVIRRAVSTTKESEIINLDPILSSLAYKDLVENLFGSKSNCIAEVVPIVTRAYEELFMREPVDKVSTVPTNPLFARLNTRDCAGLFMSKNQNNQMLDSILGPRDVLTNFVLLVG